jgi:hypothetical protein
MIDVEGRNEGIPGGDVEVISRNRILKLGRGIDKSNRSRIIYKGILTQTIVLSVRPDGDTKTSVASKVVSHHSITIGEFIYTECSISRSINNILTNDISITILRQYDSFDRAPFNSIILECVAGGLTRS